MSTMNHIGVLVLLIMFFSLVQHTSKNKLIRLLYPWYIGVVVGILNWVVFEAFYWVVYIFFLR